PPKWLQRESKPTDSSSNVRWGLDFYDAFEKEFLRQSGFELSKRDIIRSVIVVDKEKKITRAGDYFSRDYSLTDSKGQAFLAAVAKNQQRDALLVRSCGRALFAN